VAVVVALVVVELRAVLGGVEVVCEVVETAGRAPAPLLLAPFLVLLRVVPVVVSPVVVLRRAATALSASRRVSSWYRSCDTDTLRCGGSSV